MSVDTSDIFVTDYLSDDEIMSLVVNSQEKLYISFLERNKSKSIIIQEKVNENGLQQKVEITTIPNVLYIHADGLASDELIKIISLTNQEVYVAFSSENKDKSDMLQEKLNTAIDLQERVRVIESSVNNFVI
jgi:hypothetical protein